MPDFSKRYNQNEIETEYDAKRAAMAGHVVSVKHKSVSRRPVVNTSKFETEYQNFIKKLKEQKAQEQAQEAVVETVVETVEEPVVEAPKPKKKKAKVVPVDEQVVADTVVPEETPAEEQTELPTFDLY